MALSLTPAEQTLLTANLQPLLEKVTAKSPEAVAWIARKAIAYTLQGAPQKAAAKAVVKWLAINAGVQSGHELLHWLVSTCNVDPADLAELT